MPTSTLNGVIQHFLADLEPDGDGMTDGELLARFLRSREQAALAALVRRHAQMVWGVCRRLLNHHDAEDAFQATFFVLVRKAADVPRQAVANWLYGVARQTAVRLRATAAKRGQRETQVLTMPEPTMPEVHADDLQSVVDEELSHLPDHYRGVIVLCDLEGLTRKEAARQLGIPEGSVASRLARARAMLAKRLNQRGIVFSGGSVAAVLLPGAASSSAPPALVASTIKTANLLAAGQTASGVSARVAALTEGVMKAMFVTKIKSVLAVVLVVAVFAGAVGLCYRTSAAEQPQAKMETFAVAKNQNMNGEKFRANPPAQPQQPPAKTDQERIVGGWVIVNDDSGRKGEFWDIGTHQIVMNPNLWGEITRQYFHRLDATKSPKQIDITVTAADGVIGSNIPINPKARILGVIKGIYTLEVGEFRLCLGEVGKDRPAAFPAKPKRGEVLILHGPEYKADGGALLTKEEKLKALTDKVLAAHGGEDKLKKLQFTMTVKVDNGTTDQYFVQPPKHFRWESQHRDSTTKRIVILFPEGRRWWTKEPNGDAKEFIPLGLEPSMEYWLDYVKFFGPRQVLRLRDADHKVTLLDEAIKIGDRAAVGVEIAGPHFKGKMYFDKETHLLVRSGDIYYSDYKKFDDIPIARKEKHSHAGTGAWEAEVTEFRVVDKFDAKLFEQP